MSLQQHYCAFTHSATQFIYLLGVGGHGGSGIHADIDDRYREIVSRTSVYTSASRARRPYVSLSPRVSTAGPGLPVGGHSSMATTDAGSRITAVVYESDLHQQRWALPGGMSATAGIRRRGTSGGARATMSGVSRAGRVGPIGSGGQEMGGRQGQSGAVTAGGAGVNQVEQVHVPKCTVCTIL